MKLILVTGSSGFIGTNLVEKLLNEGSFVVGIDNFYSSEKWKSEIFKDNPNYEFFEHDVTKEFGSVLGKSKLLKKHGKIDEIYNLACPASPPR